LDKIPYLEDKAHFLIMGGSIGVDYNGKPSVVAEWNIRNNINASKKVFTSKLDITLVSLDSTWDLKLSPWLMFLAESRTKTDSTII